MIPRQDVSFSSFLSGIIQGGGGRGGRRSSRLYSQQHNQPGEVNLVHLRQLSLVHCLSEAVTGSDFWSLTPGRLF